MSRNRLPWQRLLIEAMTAASEFITEDMRKNFLVIGGAALVRYGSARSTQDVDIAITPQTLQAFWDRASNDRRFSLNPDGRWVYTCDESDLEGLEVGIEFLLIGGEFVPRLRGMTKFDPIWIASLPDIAIMKARALQNRAEPNDRRDFLYTLTKMKSLGQTFARYRITEDEIAALRSAVTGNEAMELLLLEVIG